MGRGNAAGNRLSQLMGLPMQSNQLASASQPSGMSAEQLRAELIGKYTTAATAPSVAQMDPRQRSLAMREWQRGGRTGPSPFGQQMTAGTPSSIDETGLQAAIQQRMAEQQQAQAQQQQQDNAAYTSDPAYGSLNKQFTGADVATDPGYQFGLNEGQRGLDNSASARGGYYSGAQLKAASRFNSDYAGTKFNDAWTRNNTDQTNTYNRLAGIAGTGQAATNNVGANGLSTAGANGSLITGNAFNNGQNTMGAGNARASSYLAGGNALQGALNQGVSAWNGYRNQDQFQPTSTWVNNNGGGF
jgi:hypothetical protein